MRTIAGILLITALIFICFPHEAFSQRNSRKSVKDSYSGTVLLKIVDKQESAVSNPEEKLLTLKVRFTNNSNRQLQFNNNNLFLEESSGKIHPVNRLRFPESIVLKPGESGECDRIYYTVNKTAQLKSVILKIKGVELGRASF